LIGSDHGHESVTETIPVERRLFEAGFKTSLESSEIVVAPQGSSAFIQFLVAALCRAAPRSPPGSADSPGRAASSPRRPRRTGPDPRRRSHCRRYGEECRLQPQRRSRANRHGGAVFPSRRMPSVETAACMAASALTKRSQR
jgi:hypothetical protein